MTQFFETGHGKNVANLLKLNQLIATFGNTYNPNNPIITAGALSTLYNSASTTLAGVNASFTTWKNATNARELAFQPLGVLATKVLAAVESTNAPKQTVNDCRFLVRKIRGDGKLTKADAGKNDNLQAIPNPNGPPQDIDNGKSNSQQSYDSKLQHLAKLVMLVQSIPGYAPNEPALQIAALQSLLTNLTALNNAANVSYANLTSARISRNLIFYAADSGMLDRVKKAKAYIKSLYGAASQQYHAARSIQFVRVVPKKKAK